MLCEVLQDSFCENKPVRFIFMYTFTILVCNVFTEVDNAQVFILRVTAVKKEYKRHELKNIDVKLYGPKISFSKNVTISEELKYNLELKNND